MKTLNLFITFNFFLIAAFAQKLPNKQSASVMAPVNVKIDGKLTEWGNLQAYNHSADIAYTIANDNENLYFIVRAENQAIVNKIINGGITFGINKTGKSNKSDIAITYPVFEKGEKPAFSGSKALLEQGANANTVSNETVLQADNAFSTKSKLIMITGISGVDTLLSIYNELSVKVAVRYDSHLAYNCELSVPLKKLGLTTDKFSYHISLNGQSPLSGKPGAVSLSAAQNEIVEAKLAAEQAEVGKAIAVTDFWGEYTLAKK